MSRSHLLFKALVVITLAAGHGYIVVWGWSGICWRRSFVLSVGRWQDCEGDGLYFTEEEEGGDNEGLGMIRRALEGASGIVLAFLL